MISKRTVYFLLGAVLATLPFVQEAMTVKPLCVQDSRLAFPRVRTGPQPAVWRPALAGASRAVAQSAGVRWLAVQSSGADDPEGFDPCPSTVREPLMKIDLVAALCLWTASFASLFKDLQKFRAARRRRKRRSRRHSSAQSAASGSQERLSQHDQAR